MSIKSITKLSTPVDEFDAELSLEFGEEKYHRHQLIGPYLVNGLGGIAEYLVVAHNTGDLVTAAKAALKHRKPYLVIAHGTGSLVSEIGFPGLVIINKTSNIVFSPHASEALVDSGVGTAELVNVAASRGYGGIEFLTAIPGTVGGAVATSAQYGGKTLRAHIKEVVMFVGDGDGGKVLSFTHKELPDQSRPLMFDKPENSPVILSVRLQLAQITQTEIFRRIMQLRKLGNPHDLATHSVSYFVQPLISEQSLGSKDFRELTFAKGIRFGKTPDVIEFRPANLPSQIRSACQSITTFLRSGGMMIEERLSYLGYWPSSNHEDNQTNAEDI